MGGAFTILEFTDENLDDLIYLENAGGESTSREDPDLIAEFRKNFILTQQMATKGHLFAEVVDAIAESRWEPPPVINPEDDKSP